MCAQPTTGTQSPHCRFCNHPLDLTMVDLGMSPLCESYLSKQQINQMEPHYPLHVYVCGQCYLVQLEEYVSPADIFTEYAYFSSYATTWLKHAENYTRMTIDRFKLDKNSFVVEVASNDGYLLQYFVEQSIPVLGVEPALNVAKAAIDKGVPTLTEFFGVETARNMIKTYPHADLVAGNNVLAQVPDLNDFVAGLKIILKPGGIITLEFPHLMKLVEGNQFDTIYHEHFSYFSFVTVEKIFAHHGLTLFDVEELSTHGGSLRIFARHTENNSLQVSRAAHELRQRETNAGLLQPDYYKGFGEQVKATKRALLNCLIGLKDQGKTIAGYGAPGKGNTLLNYCGIRTDFLDYTVDRNPYKHGKFLPGSLIPVFPPEKIFETRPDYLFILPWNFREEIMEQMKEIRSWGGKFIIPIPQVEIL